MSMVKVSPIALNLGNDFVILVKFFGTPCKSAQLTLFYDCKLVNYEHLSKLGVESRGMISVKLNHL